MSPENQALLLYLCSIAVIVVFGFMYHRQAGMLNKLSLRVNELYAKVSISEGTTTVTPSTSSPDTELVTDTVNSVLDDIRDRDPNKYKELIARAVADKNCVIRVSYDNPDDPTGLIQWAFGEIRRSTKMSQDKNIPKPSNPGVNKATVNDSTVDDSI